MPHTKNQRRLMNKRKQNGFTLLESLISIAILTIIGGAIVSSLVAMMKTQGTVENRTEMHTNVRNATELLAQEIGQAGKIPQFATPRTLAVAVGGCCGGVNPGAVLQPALVQAGVQILDAGGAPNTTGIFNNENLMIDAGSDPVTGNPLQEIVQVTAVAAGTITATFTKAHAAGAPVRVQGDFASGVVPPAGSLVGGVAIASGSDATHLKIYGDINGDGTLVYVEYDCNGNAAGTGTLNRSVTLVTEGVVVLTQAQVLLDNLIYPNPGGTPCFSYQPNPLAADALSLPVGPNNYVLDVAVTLTVQTQNRDPQTGQYQQETKALLNVAPRNVFEAYQAATFLNAQERVQPMPGDAGGLNIAILLPQTPPAPPATH